MKLKDIEYVIAIAEEGNFSKAAEKLYVSQPALSQSILKLEEELGISLFTRKNNKVNLTLAGEIFIEDGKDILSLCDKVINKMERIANVEKGTVRIGLSQYYGKYIIPKLNNYFSKYYPGIRLELTEAESSQLEKLLLSDSIDFSLIPLPISSPLINYELLFKESILLAISKSNDLANELLKNKKNELSLHELYLIKDQDFIFLKDGLKMNEISKLLCENANFSPNVIFQTENLDSVNAFVGNNMGVGFVTSTIERLDSNIYYKINDSLATRDFVIAYADKKSLTDINRKFIYYTLKSFMDIC